MSHPISELIDACPKIAGSGIAAEKVQLDVINWMELVSALLRGSYPNAEYAAAMVDQIRQRIEESAQPEKKINNNILRTEAEHVVRTIKHVEKLLQWNEDQRTKEQEERSNLLRLLTKEDIELARIRIGNRLWRAPIVLVPSALLLGAFILTVSGVIQIRGQKIDIDEIVSETVARLTEEIKKKGSDARQMIDTEVDAQLRKLREFPLSTRIEQEVNLLVNGMEGDVARQIGDRLDEFGSRVDSLATEKEGEVTSRLAQFNSKFPDTQLEEAIKLAKTATTELDVVERRIDQLYSLIPPLEIGLDEVREAKPDEIDFIFRLAQRTQWMVPAGFALLASIVLVIGGLFVRKVR